MIDAVEFFIHFFIRRKFFNVNTFTFVSFYLGVLHDVTPLQDYKFLNEDRGWKPNDHIKHRIWSVCRNTDNK